MSNIKSADMKEGESNSGHHNRLIKVLNIHEFYDVHAVKN